MSVKRLFFRTRGGPVQGWGNVFRLASFATYCRDAGHPDATFFVEGPSEVVDYLEAREFEVVRLPEDVDLATEDALFAEHGRADLAFAEMLDITPRRQAVLRRHATRLVVFDDLCDHTYSADLVVCGQELPSHANRALSDPRTQFLVGYDYFLCRPEFLSYADRRREYAAELGSLLVTLGGGRYDVGYLKAAAAIASLEWRPSATFVLGYDDRPDLRRDILEILPGALVLGGVSDIERRMWESDLVIGSAGYTKLEAAITQTPAIAMSVQWHQIPLAAEFSARTGTTDAGYMSYVAPQDLAHAIRALRPAEARRQAAQRARSVVDGRGFERVYRAAFEDRE